MPKNKLNQIIDTLVLRGWKQDRERDDLFHKTGRQSVTTRDLMRMSFPKIQAFFLDDREREKAIEKVESKKGCGKLLFYDDDDWRCGSDRRNRSLQFCDKCDPENGIKYVEDPNGEDDTYEGVMSQEEQTSKFAGELDKLVCRYSKEFSLTHASMIGCLHIMIGVITHYAVEDLNKEDEDS
jgi:hypothetical protein